MINSKGDTKSSELSIHRKFYAEYGVFSLDSKEKAYERKYSYESALRYAELHRSDKYRQGYKIDVLYMIEGGDRWRHEWLLERHKHDNINYDIVNYEAYYRLDLPIPEEV